MAVLNLSFEKVQAPSWFLTRFLAKMYEYLTELLFFDFLPRWLHHFILVLFEIVASYALKFM
jgi:hypothetical protein